MITSRGEKMHNSKQSINLVVRDGDVCDVIGGTHAGKSGTARDIKLSRSGNMTITIVQRNGERFKTLAKNVVVKKSNPT
jgi:ribosomal protein S4E